LVKRRWRLDFCFVKAGTEILHHIGDVIATDFSPVPAFFFTRLRFGDYSAWIPQQRRNKSR
jgi:hypothetical protein